MKYIPPTEFYFADDGFIPNSRYPVLLYHHVTAANESPSADWLEERFAVNGWTNSWRWGVYPYHHYHSNTHEVLGIFKGKATLQLGGGHGKLLDVVPGDVLIIPAGVGHKCIEHRNGFTVVGAYPKGKEPDLLRGKPGERPQADQNIAAVPIPETDPLFGKEGLITIWK